MRGPDLTVGQRLALGYGIPLLVLAAATTAIVTWQVQAQREQQVAVEQINKLRVASQDLDRAILYAAIVTRDYLLAPEPAHLTIAQSRFEQARGAMRTLQGLPAPGGVERLMRPLRPLVEGYLAVGERLLMTGATAPRGAEHLAELTRAREATIRQLDELRSVQRTYYAEAIAGLQHSSRTLYRRLLGAILLTIAVIVAAGMWAAFSLRRPILELLSGATGIERGDLGQALRWTETIRPDSRSELRRLARALGAAAFALQRRDRRVRADRRIADAAASTLVATEIAGEALAAVVEKMHAGLGLIYFADPRSSTLKPVATHAAGPDCPEIGLGEGLAGQAAKDQRLIVLRDIPRDAGFKVRLGYDESPPRCVAAAPIKFKDQVLGVIVIGALHNFDEYALSFLESAAAQLAAGLQNSLAHSQLRRLADDLHQEHQRVQAQSEELQAQNEELQTQGEELQAQGEEIQAQNEQLKSMADRLTLADTRKNEFLAMLAHELRNPLAAISNAQHLLARPHVAPEVIESAHRVIGRQTRQLTRLMEDLLDTARIVRGSLQVRSEPLNLVTVVRDCMEDLRPELEQAGMKLALSLPAGMLGIDGDRARLAQSIANICSNAIKYRRQGGTLEVEVRSDARHAELRIADDGMGIDPAFMPRIFEPFSQARPGGDGGGLGLGLSVVKALVESHGGTIAATSAGVGQGAEFVIRLPLAGERARSADAQPQKPGQGGDITPRL